MTLSSGGICSVLVLKFSGDYGDDDSDGDSDSDFIQAITAAACTLEVPDAVIFDLSAMSYDEGESLARNFSFPLGPEGGGARAVRIVSGPKSHDGLVELKQSYELEIK